MASVHVGVEVDTDGRALAWVYEWFGCTAHGRNEQEALNEVPAALRAFWDWLRRHGEGGVPAPGEEVNVIAVETCPVASNLHDADSEGFFSFDREAVSEEELARSRRYRSYARADVLELLDRVGLRDLALQVGRSGRNVGETLIHLAYADLWYAQRAGGAPVESEWLAFLLRELRQVAEAFIDEQLSANRPSQAVNYVSNTWDNSGRPEPWTPQKTLRRFVWHDLLHLRSLERALRNEGRGEVSP